MTERTLILAFESSCDETSVAVIENGTKILSNIVATQIDSHQRFGGVVPEVASRHHIEQITKCTNEALEQAEVDYNDLDAVAVTYGPGLIGSLLVGLQIAKTLAFVYQKPLVPVHHIAGHIYANNLEHELKFPLIALVVSGGHTDLIYMKNHFDFVKIGGTLDDAVGECYDKVARVMGIPYPGGPLVDKLAHTGKHTYELPLPLDDDTYNFSFSGIKSAVINLVHNKNQKGEEINVADLATTFQDNVVKVITKKTLRAIKEYNVKSLIVCGGVAANKGLREEFARLLKTTDIDFCVPRISYCTDNAAMIGAAGYYAYKKGIRADMSLNAKAVDSLYDYIKNM